MYRYLLIVICFLCLPFAGNTAQEVQSTAIPQYDKDKVDAYQQNSKYDYNSQLDNYRENLWEIFVNWLQRGLSRAFGSKFARTYTEPILIGIFILIILLVLWFIVRKRPELFVRNKKKKKDLAYKLEEETIYDIDFDQEIRNSLKQDDYKLAIRLTYLQTLRYLQDHNYIDWRPYKTPTEYIYEMSNKNYKEEFRQLTNHFLRIRYGNFDASLDTYQEVRELQTFIRKGGQHEK